MRLSCFVPAIVMLPALAGAAEYEIDPAHSAAHFSVRHMMISNVKGEFSKVAGTIVWEPNNLAASKVEATIDTSTIETREQTRYFELITEVREALREV